MSLHSAFLFWLTISESFFCAQIATDLELSFVLDRVEYIDREPIFLEVTVLNKGNETVKFGPIKESNYLWLDCEDKAGKKIKIFRNSVYDAPPLEFFVELAPGKSHKMWFDLRSHYIGLGTTGDFAAQLVWEAEIYDPKSKRTVIRQHRSKLFGLHVIPPRGDDTEAVNLVKATMKKPDQLKPDGDLFGWQGPIFYLDKKLCTSILGTKSDRFKAAVLYYRGEKNLSDADWRGGDSKYLGAAIQDFTSCKESKGSSQYLKGLCDYNLLVCKEFDLKGPKNKDKALAEFREMAQRIQRDYPNTAIADKSHSLLKKYEPKK